jgi:hypothetical protein
VDLPDATSVNTQYQDFDVVSGTVRLTPVQTQKTDHFLVGRLLDNVAGTTTTNAYLNIVDASVADSLPSKFVDPKLFTGTPTLDSTVLVMGFDRVYGSSSTTARFDVYKLATALDDRQVYNSSMSQPLGDALGLNVPSRLNRTQQQVVTAAVDPTPTTAGSPAVTTTVPDPSVRLVLQRRVAISSSQPIINLPFADDLFGRLRVAGFGQPQLNVVLKGLALAPSASHNSSIVSFGRPYGARLVMYFHSTSAWKVRTGALRTDTLKRTYSAYVGPVYSSGGLSSTTDPRYYTQITNTLPAAFSALNSQSGFVPNALLNGISYAQEGTGLGTRITFTGLDALTTSAKNGGLTINRAELRVPVRPYTNALFANPAQLYAVEVEANNTVLQRTINYLPTDRLVQADGLDQLGSGFPAFGTLNTTTPAQPYYSIPVTSYLQAYLTDKLSGNPVSLVLTPDSSPLASRNGISTIQPYNTLTLNRAALDAPNIKLRVYYSKR